MRYSDIKKLRRFCDGLLSSPDWREVVMAIDNQEPDFEVNGVRFINKDDIDRIMAEEMESDLYVLGCFNAWFIAEVTGIDEEMIKDAQERHPQSIGLTIQKLGLIEKMAKAYAQADGYGHHFNHYDGGEDEIFEYFVFDNH